MLPEPVDWPDIQARVDRAVPRLDPDACWPKGSNFGEPKPIMVAGRTYAAHRLAWAAANRSQIPAGMLVLHACGRRWCCNPAHLRLGNQKQNAADRQMHEEQERLGAPRSVVPAQSLSPRVTCSVQMPKAVWRSIVVVAAQERLDSDRPVSRLSVSEWIREAIQQRLERDG